MKSRLFFATIIVILPAAYAEASEPRPLPRPWFWYHHASTALEGALRGYGDYISAVGEFLVNRSYAEYVFQKARRLSLKTDQERILARWRIRDAYRDREYGNHVAPETVAKVNRARLPERLPPHVLGPVGFTIHWPSTFLCETFDSDRRAMASALSLRANGQYGAGSSAHGEAVIVRDRMLAKLKTSIGELSPMEYMAAKRFVESLAYETLHAPVEKIAGQ